ncbi:hypothetical protein VPHD85_0023 [Vibrio phage D85]|nr:TMhelix containing protein [Vibrio phage 1.205.O._10N.222.51.A7]QZI91317.1 hypothetical protein PODOV033v1_p0010 [Vibrio phage 252E42.2]
MQRQVAKSRQIDLSKSDSTGIDMISAKFIIICGLLMAIISLYITIPLAIGSAAVSAYNLAAKPTSKTYIVSVTLLLIIAMRAAWIMQGAS